MRPRLYKTIFWIAFIGILIFIFGIVNTMVSLKYETDSLDECISKVTGNDLCQSIQTLKILIGVCIATIIAMLIFKGRLLKTEVKQAD